MKVRELRIPTQAEIRLFIENTLDDVRDHFLYGHARYTRSRKNIDKIIAEGTLPKKMVLLRRNRHLNPTQMRALLECTRSIPDTVAYYLSPHRVNGYYAGGRWYDRNKMVNGLWHRILFIHHDSWRRRPIIPSDIITELATIEEDRDLLSILNDYSEYLNVNEEAKVIISLKLATSLDGAR